MMPFECGILVTELKDSCHKWVEVELVAIFDKLELELLGLFPSVSVASTNTNKHLSFM